MEAEETPKDGLKDEVQIQLDKQKAILELEAKRIDNFEKKLKIKGLPKKDELETSKNQIEKINSLRFLMADWTIDVEGNTIPGGEAKFKPLLGERDLEIIRKKIMQLVKNL